MVVRKIGGRKMIYIMSSEIWAKSRKLLIERLGKYYEDHEPKIVLNFVGNYRNDDIKVLNGKIHHIQDKVEMNKLFDEYGILHPKTYYHPFDDLPNTNNECVLKKRFGSRGKGIVFTTFDKIDKSSLTSNDYIQDYVPFDKEYRIGVTFKRVLGIREKIGNCRIRNSKTCKYITRHIDKLGDFAFSLAKQFELDFTGIDIGEWKGTYIVIELNSAPTIGPDWARKLKNDLVGLYHALYI